MKLDARALGGERLARVQLDRLYAAIEVNDHVDLDAPPPSAMRLDYPQGRLIDGFRLSRQLWQDGFDRSALAASAAALARTNTFDAIRFKQVRAKFKHLRFAFVLYSRDHRCPPMFKMVTTVMGQVQDAARGDRREATVRQAWLLRALLARLPQRVLRGEVDRLEPCDPAGFRAFTLAQMRALRVTLDRPMLDTHRFHAARKMVSRQVSFHDDMRTLIPDPDHDATARYLATINGLMGQFHDVLVARRAAGDLHPSHDRFAMPEPIRERLATLTALYS